MDSFIFKAAVLLLSASFAAAQTAGSCYVNGRYYAQGDEYFPPDSTCSVVTCRCNPNGTGVVNCWMCPRTIPTGPSTTPTASLAGSCYVNGRYYAQGDAYFPPGSTCNVATCRCHPSGTGVVNCWMCPRTIPLPTTTTRTTTTTAVPSLYGSCYVNGRYYAQGEQYFPPGSTCNVATCRCDPSGSGVINCRMCPRTIPTTTTTTTPTPTPTNYGYCYVNGRYYVRGQTYFPPGSTCSVATCRCSATGNGAVSCWACPTTTTPIYTPTPTANQGYCYNNGYWHAPGSLFQDTTFCSTPKCMCDINKTGRTICSACQDCNYQNSRYAPGQSFNPPGQTCATPMCKCNSLGQVSCVSTCASGSSGSTSLKACVVDGVSHAAGTKYYSSGPCSQPQCTCDPAGSGNGFCGACPDLGRSLNCIYNSQQYSAGDTFAATNCYRNNCICNASGTGVVNCSTC